MSCLYSVKSQTPLVCTACCSNICCSTHYTGMEQQLLLCGHPTQRSLRKTRLCLSCNLHCSISTYLSEHLHAVLLTECDSNLTFTSPLITGLSSKPMTTESLSESKKSWKKVLMKGYCRDKQFMTTHSYSLTVHRYNETANNLSCSHQSELMHLTDLQGNLSPSYHYFACDLADLSFIFILLGMNTSIQIVLWLVFNLTE